MHKKKMPALAIALCLSVFGGTAIAAESQKAPESAQIIAESAALREELENFMNGRKSAGKGGSEKSGKEGKAENKRRQAAEEEAPAVLGDSALDYNLGCADEKRGDTTLHTYKSGCTFEVGTAKGYLTDIALEAGEKPERVTLGDSARWQVSTYKDKNRGVWHIYVQPIQQGISTNMVIATDRRNYQLLLKALGEYEPMVAWRYPGRDPLENALPRGEIVIEDFDKLNFGYTVSPRGDKFAPRYVFDDGEHLFLAFEPELLSKVSPAVFAPGNGGVVLTDYIKSGANLIIDRIYPQLELRVRSRVIHITRGKRD